MASTQVSQTLYRFVSVRAPQMSEENEMGIRFVFRSPEVKQQPGSVNVFDEAAGQQSNTPLWERLQTAATAFKQTAAYIGSESVLKQITSGQFVLFTAWLASKRYSFTNAELLARTDEFGAAPDTAVLTRIWNNLMYQVITQESFYIKEVLMQVLIGSHVLQHLNRSETEDTYPWHQKLVTAKVVLPKEVFGGITGVTATGSPGVTSSGKLTPPSSFIKQQQAITAAGQNKAVYNDVIKTLSAIEKTYSAEYQSAYEAAYKTYRQNIASTLEQYKQDQQSGLNSWCSTRNNTNPYNPEDPCNKPPYIPFPTLPDFNFSFEPEGKFIKGKLSSKELDVITKLGMNTGAASFDNARFVEVFELLNNAVFSSDNQIIENTSPSNTGVATIGEFPVTLTPESPSSTIGLFQFQICPRTVGTRIYFDMAFQVPDSSWIFEMIQYCNDDPAVGGYSYYSEYSRTGNTIFLGNLFGDNAYPFLTSGNYPYISGKIYFTNGQEKQFMVSLANFNYALCTTGLLVVPDEPGTGGGNSGGSSSSAFIPAGFGIKQLGIADYRKVVQTVHCYVEGEVAHIENIMAREYKEKSTRRLRRDETTVTTSTESEREQLSDTTSTSRFEMQNEVSKMLQEDRDYTASAFVQGRVKDISFGANASLAAHSSREESIRAAVTEAKDITERALERIVSKVKQERVEKIIEEFEENNKHGFDNTKGDKHVVGVYRWVDKVYKNQVYNYGKRLMFEFMIPEPGRLHYLSTKETKESITSILIKPDDPRTANNMKIENPFFLDAIKARYWAGLFNIEVDPYPQEYITEANTYGDARADRNEAYSKNESIEIKEGYKAVEAKIYIQATWDNDGPAQHGIGVAVGNGYKYANNIDADIFQTAIVPLDNIEHKLPVSYQAMNYLAFNMSVTVKLRRGDLAIALWQHKGFKAIIDAYEIAKKAYEDALAGSLARAAEALSGNPGFYRQIENMVLRKNCISYLTDQTPGAPHAYGKKMYKDDGANSFNKYEVNLSSQLDDYASFVKFLEQAFEWEIMSYYLYPFYWGNRDNWTSLYKNNDSDPIFRNFMQSGMARVIVTVRPGFEDAVRFYMQTGLIWNGGEVPVIDDPLYLSIADEMRQPLGVPEGKAWATRLPTALTILQADSIGLKVEKALPCNCADVTPQTWESPETVPCGDSFEMNNYQLNTGDAGKHVQFSFTAMDKGIYQEIGTYDNNNAFPRSYLCMGQTITIERDATWEPNTSSIVIFQKLAQQLSLIEGITAVQFTDAFTNPNGIRFTIDRNIIQSFSFTKPGDDEVYDVLLANITPDTVSFLSPTSYVSRVLDKSGVPLASSEVNMLLPISRFSV